MKLLCSMRTVVRIAAWAMMLGILVGIVCTTSLHWPDHPPRRIARRLCRFRPVEDSTSGGGDLMVSVMTAELAATDGKGRIW